PMKWKPITYTIATASSSRVSRTLSTIRQSHPASEDPTSQNTPAMDTIVPATHSFAPVGLRYFDARHTGTANQNRWPGCRNQIQLTSEMPRPRNTTNIAGCIGFSLLTPMQSWGLKRVSGLQQGSDRRPEPGSIRRVGMAPAGDYQQLPLVRGDRNRLIQFPGELRRGHVIVLAHHEQDGLIQPRHRSGIAQATQRFPRPHPPHQRPY